MAHDDHGEHVPLARRIRLLGQGFRSSMRRYPRFIVESLGAASPEAGGGVDLAAAWAGIDKGPEGLSAVSWLGHCTTLIGIGGLTVMTDPVLSSRIGVRLSGVTIGPGRLLPPAPSLLPRPDLILISHAHFDHLDRPTLRVLADRGTTVVTATRTGRLIPEGFGAVYELPWGEELEVGGVRVRSLRPVHWGARKGIDRGTGYCSYVVESPGAKVLFAGDTAYTRAFEPEGPIDLGIFGVGAYDPWRHLHATPEEVWAMAGAARCRRILPVHHSTFQLSDEPAHEPVERLLAAAGGASGKIIPAEVGKIVRLG